MILIDVFGILCLINFVLAYVIGMVMVDDDICPIFFQSYLYEKLDKYDINFIGKLIVCVLTVPFTMGYTIMALMSRMTRFIVMLFFLLFRKR